MDTTEQQTFLADTYALIDLIDDIGLACQQGISDEQLIEARSYQRKAQFLVDFVRAENSMGFHASQESARILLQSIDYTRKGQLSLYQNSKK